MFKYALKFTRLKMATPFQKYIGFSQEALGLGLGLGLGRRIAIKFPSHTYLTAMTFNCFITCCHFGRMKGLPLGAWQHHIVNRVKFIAVILRSH